ncbi:MAG: hypothetical protein OXN89_03990 [Bryobacterales bacterium]|nr:hypothetical protein [Bryobacterales bacterium]
MVFRTLHQQRLYTLLPLREMVDLGGHHPYVFLLLLFQCGHRILQRLDGF